MSGDVGVESPAPLPGERPGPGGTKFSLFLPVRSVLSRSATLGGRLCPQFPGLRVALAIAHAPTRRQVTTMLVTLGVDCTKDPHVLDERAAAPEGAAPARHVVLFDAQHPQSGALQSGAQWQGRAALVAAREVKFASNAGVPVLAVPVAFEALTACLEELTAGPSGMGTGTGTGTISESTGNTSKGGSSDPASLEIGFESMGNFTMPTRTFADFSHFRTGFGSALPAPHEPQKVLLVAEDNCVNQLLIQMQLERLNCQAVICGNGLKVHGSPPPVGCWVVIAVFLLVLLFSGKKKCFFSHAICTPKQRACDLRLKNIFVIYIHMRLTPNKKSARDLLCFPHSAHAFLSQGPRAAGADVAPRHPHGHQHA